MDNNVDAYCSDTATGTAAYEARLQTHSQMFDADKNSWSTVKGASLAATNNGDKVYVYDAGRPVSDVPATNAQKQADVLSTLCGNANATCTSTPTAQSEYVADPKFSTYYVNPTSVQQEFTAKFSHRVKESTTWNSAHR